jgi:hypothetical protein
VNARNLAAFLVFSIKWKCPGILGGCRGLLRGAGDELGLVAWDAISRFRLYCLSVLQSLCQILEPHKTQQDVAFCPSQAVGIGSDSKLKLLRPGGFYPVTGAGLTAGLVFW